MRTLSTLLIFLSGLSHLAAELAWEDTEITPLATLADKAIEQEFVFRNEGSSDITITAIKPSCGCTTAALEKREYRPGEGGRLTVTFTFGQRRGLQRNKIRVETSDGKFTDLLLSVDIPVALTAEPRYLRWRRGDALEEKRVKIHLNEAGKVGLQRMELDSDQFQTRIEPTKDPWIKELVITPKQTTSLVSAHLNVIADKPLDHPAALKVYLRIH